MWRGESVATGTAEPNSKAEFKAKKHGLGCSSVAEPLPSMPQALGSIPRTTKKKKKKVKHVTLFYSQVLGSKDKSTGLDTRVPSREQRNWTGLQVSTEPSLTAPGTPQRSRTVQPAW